MQMRAAAEARPYKPGYEPVMPAESESESESEDEDFDARPSRRPARVARAAR